MLKRMPRTFAHLIQALAIASIGLTAARCPAAWAFGAQITPPIVEKTIGRGQTASGTIEVQNESDDPVELEVYLQDWEYTEGGTGDKLFSVPGSSPWSASGWVSFYPQKLSLPSRGKAIVEYTIRVPADAPPGGRTCVMFFESALGKSAADDEGVSVQYTGRIGSLFEVHVAGTVERVGEISKVDVGVFSEDRPLSLGYTFANKGNIAIRPKTVFNIVDASGRYFGRGEFKQLYTFPGRFGSATTEWKGSLKPGDYTVVVTADLGERQVVVAEHPLRVPGNAGTVR